MRASAIGMQTIDCNGSLYVCILRYDPEAVPLRVVSSEELGQFGGDLCLEKKAEAPVLPVVKTVKLGNPSD
jgi:hypothetical protein